MRVREISTGRDMNAVRFMDGDASKFVAFLNAVRPPVVTSCINCNCVEVFYPGQPVCKYNAPTLIVDHPDHIALQQVDDDLFEVIESDESTSSFKTKMQVGGDHYAIKPVQPWDLIRVMDSSGNAFVDYLRGEVIAYVWRNKGRPIEDLKKAYHCLGEAIKEMEAMRHATFGEKTEAK